MKTNVVCASLFLILTFTDVKVLQEYPLIACFFSKYGITQIQPKTNDIIEPLPDHVQGIVVDERDEYLSILNQQFDLSKITKPEPEADDVTIDTKKIFQENKLRDMSQEYIWILL